MTSDASPQTSSLPAVIGGLFLLGSALALSPEALGVLSGSAELVERPGVAKAILALRLGLALFGLLILGLRPRLARTPFVAGVALAFLIAGLWGRWQASRPAAWKAPGIPMAERLARLRDAEVRIYGPTPEDIQKNHERAQENPGTKQAVVIGHSLARALRNRGRYDEAAAILEGIEERLSAREVQPAIISDIRHSLVATYLRSGEEANCVSNHNYDSCLLPITGGGVHRSPEPSRKALALLRVILEEDPDDLIARWVYNVAAMTTGDYPDAVPTEWLIAPEAFESERDFPRFYDVAPELGIAANAISGGSILEDLDGDGDLDVVASSMRLDDQLRYFENQGDGSFEERTEEAGLAGQFGGLNISHGDYDNDGLADILVLRGGWMGEIGDMPNSLLHNEGGGRFRDVTEEAGVLAFRGGQVGVWADFDLDGWLDLFVGNESGPVMGYPYPCELYRNRGDGTFEDVIEGSGIQLHGIVKGAAWGDYDSDGRPDLYISRNGRATEEFSGGDPRGANSLYKNECQGGVVSFRDVTQEAGLGQDLSTFAAWFFDYDNDGHQDLFVAPYASSFGSSKSESLRAIPSVRLGLELDAGTFPRLYRNRGDGSFEETSEEAGLQRVVMVMGANFGDVDSDGWLDVYLGTGHTNFLALMANRMFRNAGGERFEDVTTAGGFGHLQKGHGISFGDVDNDGDQDVYAVMGGWLQADTFPNALFINPGNENHWSTLRLVGSRSNRTAVGARIALTLETPEGPRAIHRVVGTGGSFGSSSLQQEIGLGNATGIEAIEVAWPASGATQRFENVPLDRFLEIREGEEKVRVLETDSFSIEPSAGSGEAHDHAHH